MAGSSVDFVPMFVRDRMDVWDFPKAMTALTIAERTMATAQGMDDELAAFGVSETATRLSRASTMHELRAIRRGLEEIVGVR